MNTKTLLSIILKIVGVIAFWKAVQAFGTMLSGFGIMASLFSSKIPMSGTFMAALAFSMIFGFFLPLAVAFVFLFRTERVLGLLRLNQSHEVPLALDKNTIYHLVVVVFGCLAILNGLTSFVSISYNEDTKTEHTQHYSNTMDDQKSPTNGSKTDTVTISKDKKVNYFALIELILGIVLLTKSTKASAWLLASVPMSNPKDKE